MDFKKLLDDYMKQLDCTAKDLAEKSGLSAATISRYRSGDRTQGRWIRKFCQTYKWNRFYCRE